MAIWINVWMHGNVVTNKNNFRRIERVLLWETELKKKKAVQALVTFKNIFAVRSNLQLCLIINT